MKWLWIGLVVFWIITILFPEILVFLIWGFFIFLWLNLLAFFWSFGRKREEKEDYVKFWNYKIYRDKNKM